MTRLLAAGSLALVLLLVGCGEDSDPPAPADPAGPGAEPEVVAEVQRVAPALESAYRGEPYPQSVAEVVATLEGAGVELAAGTEVGAYAYDPDAVEFVLCLQDADGAWASYDTAPMGVRDAGESGGCPAG